MSSDLYAVRASWLAWIPCLALSAATAAQTVRPTGHDGEMGWEACSCGKEMMIAVRAALGLTINEPGTPAFSDREAFTDTDVLHNEADIEVFPATATIAGSNTITVKSLVPGLTQFTFMLRGNFSVQRGLSGNAADNNRVTLNGGTVAVCSTPPADNSSYARTVTLDRAYGVGEVFTVRIDYTGPAVSRGFGSIEFGTQNGVDVVASLSEPYYAATWVPVKDGDVLLPGNNADKATWELAVTAPDSLTTTANGLLQGIDIVAGGKKKYRWATAYPMSTYLGAFCTTAYDFWSQTYTYPLPGGGTGTMPVEFYIYPASNTAGNRAAWEKCIPMLAAFRGVYGEYPFVNEKYGIYQFPFGGGMEHQTNTGQGTFAESVTAHELAHQWWGDNVTCKTWNHIWLNEGSATYGEALWEERKPGSLGLPALQAAMNARRPTQVNNSVYVPATNDLNRIFSSNFTYRKGGWVLHQLRRIIGDAAFFQTLQDYRAAFGGSAATTEDLRDVASAAAGVDLTNYFQQAVYGIGAPSYAFGWQPAVINGQQYLRLSIRQTQNSAWPGTGTPSNAFAYPIDLAITTDQGVESRVVVSDARTEHYVIPLSAAATGVALDPNDWLLIVAKDAEAYVNGPAKIVQASPAPEGLLDNPPSTLTVTFSEPVNTQGSYYTLTGPGGPVAASYAYNAASYTVTLTPAAPLAPGAYSLTVSPSVTAVASGQSLDGEIIAGVLPSGDGQPGGAAIIAFTIGAPCDADVNCDGAVNGIDVEIQELAVGGDFADYCQPDADFNQDGAVNGTDVEAVELVVGGGECP
ncbi:MAG: hypothetical protein HBSAPP03_26930 [Phycisphaerae bacterium]|nr:MAG: hypothetical protein HBSAPP03_26930 [Phycisphaerae bacterium]